MGHRNGVKVFPILQWCTYTAPILRRISMP